MRIHLYRALSFIAILPVSVVCSLPAQTTSQASIPAERVIWARLQGNLDTQNATTGAGITARVMRDWSNRTCMLRTGAVLTGTLGPVDAKAASSRAATVALLFSATCSEGQSLPVKLVALLYPSEDRTQHDIAMAMPQGIGTGASGRQSTNLDAMPSPAAVGPDLPSAIRIGEVKGVRHVALDASAATNRSSVLSSPDSRLRLQQGTRMAFLVITE